LLQKEQVLCNITKVCVNGVTFGFQRAISSDRTVTSVSKPVKIKTVKQQSTSLIMTSYIRHYIM